MKIITSITIALVASASGAILADYSFATDLSATTSGVTATDLAGGAGFTVSHSTVYGITTQAAGLDGGVGSALSGAVSSDEYFTFTISDPGTDNAMNLTSLDGTFRLRGNGAQDFYFFSDVNGAVGFTPTEAFASYTGVSDGDTFSIDLTGADFQGLSSVEFRVVVDNRITNTSIASDTGFAGLQLNGDIVPIPEPTSAALLGLGGLALVTRRKR